MSLHLHRTVSSELSFIVCQNCIGKVENKVYVDLGYIILRKTEIWDEMFNFEDNIRLLSLNKIIWKDDPQL